jgi:porphobilinogen deaminase
VGVHARPEAGGRLELSAWLGLPDGSQWIADRVVGEAGALADQLVARLESVGARELLAAAEADGGGGS